MKLLVNPTVWQSSKVGLPSTQAVEFPFTTVWLISAYFPGMEHSNGVEGGEEGMDTADPQRRGTKRPIKATDHESDDEGAAAAPPVNDIYRSRQQKRVH